MTTFSAACVCFAPAEIISGVLLLLASLLLFRWDRAILRREAAALSAGAADAGAGAEPPAKAAGGEGGSELPAAAPR